MPSKIITVYGKVQGVAYRYHAKKQADELGVSGYCYNATDGSVHIHASGRDEALGSLIRWAKTGSPAAQVSHITIEDADSEVDLTGLFEIRR